MRGPSYYSCASRPSNKKFFYEIIEDVQETYEKHILNIKACNFRSWYYAAFAKLTVHRDIRRQLLSDFMKRFTETNFPFRNLPELVSNLYEVR